MPVDSHLSWSEVRDFSGGLWTVNSQLIPANGAQVMTDCFPAPAGGLKAWFKATTFTTSGVGDTTLERPRMLFVHENVDGAGNNDNYLLTYNTSTTVCKLYRMNEAASQTTWNLIKTHAAGLDPGFIRGTAYWTQAADGSQSALYLAYALGAGAGADHGLWTVKQSDGTITQQYAANVSYAFAYQSRLCAIIGPTIHFTDAGSFANISTNLANIDIAEGQANILFVATFSPGDLLVFKEGAPIYLVEGDLNNFTVRQMNGSKPVQIGGPNVVRGPQGLIFRVGSDGVYETPDGSFINPLSKQISSQSFTSTLPMVWMNHWLFAPGPGMVFDYDSHAWFTYSGIPNGGPAFQLPRLGGIFFADNASPFTLWKVIPADGRTDNRADNYTWKSPPLRDNNGRQMEIRAVQVYARSFNGATSTVSVTVNGVTQTLACDSSGRGGLTFYFLARKEELDVQVQVFSNASGVAAPDIETIRFAGQPGHFLRQVADVG